MIANRLNQVVIPSKFMSKRKKDIKSFLESIEEKMLPTISLPLKIQAVIDKQELQQLEEQQQPLGGQGNNWRNNWHNNQDNDQRNGQGKARNGKAWWKQQPAGDFRLGTSRAGEIFLVIMRQADTMWKSSRRSKPLTTDIVKRETKQ